MNLLWSDLGNCASETRAMRQEPTPAVRQDSLGHWRRIVPVLQHAWHVGRCQLRNLWQQADTLVTPLSERPLWCAAAGLLAGSLLGTAVDLPLVPLSSALLIAGLLLLPPWPAPQVQR